MARIRSIKPEFPADEKLATVSRDARLTFVLLMTQADDEGLILASPRQLLGLLYPFDDTVTPQMLRGWIDELVAAAERVRWRKTTGGAPVLELPNWKKHQKIDKPTPSKIRPLLAPLAGDSTNPPREGSEDPATSPPLKAEVGAGSGSGVGGGEVDLSEGKGESTSRVENPAPANGNTPPACAGNTTANDPNGDLLASVPVRRWVDAFYPAPRKGEKFGKVLERTRRREDILQQLQACLTAAGTKLNKNTVVHAYDVPHLETCCAAIDPSKIRQPDKAIHVLLVKLGETWAETRALREKPPEIPRGRALPAGAPTSISEGIEKYRRERAHG